ncbi:MAG: metal-sulfur cluster assembly factor [Candidatus Nanohaloarchaea archaeon]
MVQEEDVQAQLEEVVDPELNVNIVDLGLVRDIDVDGDSVHILMTLTTPGCPLHSVFDELVTREVEKLDSVEEVEVELTFEPKWSPDEMSEEARDELGNVPGMQMF